MNGAGSAACRRASSRLWHSRRSIETASHGWWNWLPPALGRPRRPGFFVAIALDRHQQCESSSVRSEQELDTADRLRPPRLVAETAALGGRRGIETAAIIDDADPDEAVARLGRDADLARAGMLDHIGESHRC
jgi:hypothetical protein